MTIGVPLRETLDGGPAPRGGDGVLDPGDRVNNGNGSHGRRLSETVTRSTRIEAPLGSWVLALVVLGALVVAFIQAPGRIVDDSKLPLIMAPWSFMTNALHLWNPTQSSGAAQSLTFGYLFPMGPFFALGHALHLPVWCTERLWLALLLSTSFWGVVRLAEGLGIGTRPGRVLGAVAYTTAPIVVTWASTSAALLAFVLLPWVLVPLVRGAAGGSPRRAAAASGVAIALMGGVNPTVVAATLPAAAIWLLTRQRGPRRRRLIGWWLVAVVLACSWWVAAVAVQSRYGYNYLPYTETSSVTTATTSLFEAVRGASYWTDYYTLGGPLFPGAWTLVSSVGAIAATAVVSAFGLAGLARRHIPQRLFLVATLLFGILLMAVGYAGPLGSPVAHGVQSLLGGPLALLRNVSKFSPDVVLPLTLGLASLVPSMHRRPAAGRALGWLRPAHARPWVARPARRRATSARAFARWAMLAVIVAALVEASVPFWQRQLYPPGGFRAIPSYWKSAAHWLDSHQRHGTALVVPGASFGEYTWGRPLDEPLSVLLSGSWTVRSLVPFGSNGNDQVLDTVESSLDQGVAQPGMADYLARAGFDYVVVRNDLDLAATGAPPPAQVRQVLSETTGVRQVAGFGPVIPPRQAAPSNVPALQAVARDHGLQSVQIYQVAQPVPVVHAYPAADPVVVSGSPSSLLPLAASGILHDRAAVLAGDPHGGREAAEAPSATWADTDGNQRRDVSFGFIRNNASYVLGPHQRTSLAVAHVPQNLAVVPGVVHQTVAAPVGAAGVSASSYGSSPLAIDPAEGPAAAFDGNESTAWVAHAQRDSVGQWVEITFDHPVALRTIDVRPLADGPRRPTVTGVTISTASGSVRRHLHPGVNTLALEPGSSTWLRIRLSGVRPARDLTRSRIPLGAGLTTVTIPGVEFRPALRLPADETTAFAGKGGNDLTYSFSATPANINPDLDIGQNDDPQMARRFNVPSATSLVWTGFVQPVPGAALNSLEWRSVRTYGPGAFVLPCGEGPELHVDGSALRTTVMGPVSDLTNLQLMPFAVCGGPVSLSRGDHLVEAGSSSGALMVTGLQAGPAHPVPAQAPRPVRVVGPWTADRRSVEVGPGSASYLVVAQNYNSGWHASLGGRTLAPVRVDGWQQGYVVPAGAGGTVVMNFAPNKEYQLALVLGAVLLGVLGLLALVRGRRRDWPSLGAGQRVSAVVVVAGGIGVLALVAGRLALLFLPVVIPVVISRRWGRYLSAVVACLAFLGAGAAVAFSPGAQPGTHLGSFGTTAQVLSALALCGVLASVVQRGPQRGSKTPEEGDGRAGGGIREEPRGATR